MFTPDLTRPPAPELTPDQFLTVLEFEGGADTFEEAEAASCSESQVKPGQVWKRKRGGNLVTVERIHPWYTQHDVIYRDNETKRTGAIWDFNFVKTYELVIEVSS